MTPKNTVAELRALLDKATPGPWSRELIDGGLFHDQVWLHLSSAVAIGSDHEEWPEDAALIAALRNAAPDLLDAYEAATGDGDGTLKYWHDQAVAFSQRCDELRVEARTLRARLVAQFWSPACTQSAETCPVDECSCCSVQDCRTASRCTTTTMGVPHATDQCP